MTIPVLYDFQEELEYKTQKAMSDGHRHIMVQSPTGSGKTVMFAKNVYNADKKGKRCLIITDRIELLTGSDDTLVKFEIDAVRILAGQKYPPKEYTHCVAMSQTLRLRIKHDAWNKFFNSFDLVIIDEAHVQEFNIYFIESAFSNNPFILAYTATPRRSRKQRQLADDYTHLIEGPQIPDLIRRGFLVPDKYYAPKHFDTTGLGINSFGDFKDANLFKKFEETISYDSVVNNWKQLAENTITIVFCVNIKHTMKTCKAFNDAGIKSRFIVSGLSKPKLDPNCSDEQFVIYKEKKATYDQYCLYMALYSGDRSTIINDWKQRKFDVLINTGIYTKGFDYKAIQTVVIYRSTMSESLWLQMIGRGSRTYQGKDHFKILDFGSNAERLGMYNQERKFSLHHSTSESSGVAPVKECGIIGGKIKEDKNKNKGCGCLILASKKICNYCGYVFEHEIVEIDVDLVHIEYVDDSKFNDNTFAKFERYAEDRGYKFGWVINRVIAEGGEEMLTQYAKYKNYKNGWLFSTKKRYDSAITNFNKKELSKQE